MASPTKSLLNTDSEDESSKQIPNFPGLIHNNDDDDDTSNEVMKFPTNCSHCQEPTELTMHMTTIPHFKEVILMCMVCDHCGFKTSEVKGAGVTSNVGSKLTLVVQRVQDLNRHVVKSESAGICIPELELELQEGGMTGMYTTVQGLLRRIRDDLEVANPFGSNDDSCNSTKRQRYQTLLEELRLFSEGERLSFTLIINDPLANSFVAPLGNDFVSENDSLEDSSVTIEKYERSKEQNEALGLEDVNMETVPGMDS